MSGGAGQVPEEYRDREQREAGHEHAGDGARAEGEGEPLLEPALCGGGGAHVRAHRDVHPDEARYARQDGADDETDHRNDAEEHAHEYGHADADDGDGGVLALEIGLRAFLDGGGDFLHSLIAGARIEHLAAGDEAVNHGEQSQPNRYEH